MSSRISASIKALAQVKVRIVSTVFDTAKSVVTHTHRWVMAALEWHRRKLVTDPTYPLALLAIGKAVIRISIPKAAIAAALIAVLAEVLGDLQRPRWMDDEEDWEF